MQPLFADASFYVALLSPRDAKHEAAAALARRLRRGIVVTEFVLLEVGNAVASRRDGRALFVALVRSLRDNPRVRIVPASTDLFSRGLDLYERRPDKAWSVTDCVSFVVMQDLSLAEALTADRHFEQAGFTVLMK